MTTLRGCRPGPSRHSELAAIPRRNHWDEITAESRRDHGELTPRAFTPRAYAASSRHVTELIIARRVELTAGEAWRGHLGALRVRATAAAAAAAAAVDSVAAVDFTVLALELLAEHGVDHVDVLSIDIDSDDLRVWESMQGYSPDVVIIEYNPVIPFDTRYVNPPGEMHGNAALSIAESADERGYALVEGTDTNLIFVRRESLAGTGLAAKTLQAIKDQTFQLRYFAGYDGTLLHTFDKLNDAGIREFFPVPWALSFGIQPVPRMFRKYRDRPNYGALAFFIAEATLRAPLQLFKLCGFVFGALSGDNGVASAMYMLRDKSSLTKFLKTGNDDGTAR